MKSYMPAPLWVIERNDRIMAEERFRRENLNRAIRMLGHSTQIAPVVDKINNLKRMLGA